MDKGKQPTIWAGHNFNRLTEEAFRRSEEKARAQAVGKVLGSPDHREGSAVGFLHDNALSCLNRALRKVFEVELSSGASNTVSIKLFNPHECVVDDSKVMPVEMSTSVVALDAHELGSIKRDGPKAGSILLFKVAGNLIEESAPDITAKDLAWGENCRYGAFVDGDAINYFEIAQTSGDVVQSELRRNDPTEENGQSVEMQVVMPGKDRLIVQELPSLSDKALQLEQELDKFIASRPARTDCLWRWLVLKCLGN